MKEIKAIIRPGKLRDVAEELHAIDGMPGVTVSEIKGFGKGKARNANGQRFSMKWWSSSLVSSWRSLWLMTWLMMLST